MPKVVKSRHSNHAATTPNAIINRKFSQPETHCEKLNDIQDIENLSTNTILKELNNPQSFQPTKERVRLPLDEKRQRRLQAMRQAPKPYSKSHDKRLKKKSKEIGKIGNLESVKTALNELTTLTETIQPINHLNPTKSKSNSSIKPKPEKTKKSPNVKQRANLLDEETSRLPNILNHPEFKLDAFAALRTHIKNSFKA